MVTPLLGCGGSRWWGRYAGPPGFGAAYFSWLERTYWGWKGNFLICIIAQLRLLPALSENTLSEGAALTFWEQEFFAPRQ